MARSSTPAFSTPSPGEILRQKEFNTRTDFARTKTNSGEVDVAGNMFRDNFFADALRERGVLLAPLLVQWNYQVPAAKPFTKWIKTKDIVLSKARLGINENTADVHYFGTYVAQEGESPSGSKLARPSKCQTLWGFSSEAAMNHMFDLCRGRIERVSIVENDLRDFVAGLKGHIREAGQEHFSQTVLVAPAAL